MSGRRGLQDGLGFGSVERDSSFNKLKNFLSLSVFFSDDGMMDWDRRNIRAQRLQVLTTGVEKQKSRKMLARPEPEHSNWGNKKSYMVEEAT